MSGRDNKRRQVTSNDVAQLAGVSQSTVSRVFRGDARISPAMLAAVQSAAAQLEYTPNAFARGMIQRSSGLIGVVVDDLASPLQSRLLDGLLHGLERMGRPPLLVRAHWTDELNPALTRLQTYRVDAIVVCAPTLPSALQTRLARDGVPVVLLNRYPSGDLGPAVARCDNFEGGAAMARHLISIGHRRFGIIDGPAGAPAATERAQGFRVTLEEAGINPAISTSGQYTYEEGSIAAMHLLSVADRPNALFCCNDLMAMGAIDAARHILGLRVPDDVSIAGFDGIEAGNWSAYRLTTMEQNIDAMVSAALTLVQDRLRDPALPAETRLIPAKLLLRQSTSFIRGQ